MNPDVLRLLRDSSEFFIYAEDNSDSVLLLRLALRRLQVPISMIHCSDGHAFIDLLKAAIDNGLRLPKFVLLDLHMPGLAGLEVLRWLRKTPEVRHIPVYIFTSSPLDSDRALAMSSGANDYIVKSVAPEDIRKELCRLLLRSGISPVDPSTEASGTTSI